MLDYIATGKVDPEQIADRGRRAWPRAAARPGCALIGGETAEHPGVMAPDDLDLAGFAVGVVERDAELGPERVVAGRRRSSGSPSPGLRSNGYTLARHVLLRAGRPRPRGPGLGGGGPHAGRRAAAALGDLRPGGARGAGGPGRRAPRRRAHHRAAASSGNLPRVLPERTRRRARAVVVGRAADLRRDPAASARSTRTRWTGSSTSGIGMVLVVAAERRRRCRSPRSAASGQPASGDRRGGRRRRPACGSR